MALPAKRLNTSQSEGNMSRLSEPRRQKLLNIKAREDLKDALTEKFKGRFGHSSNNRAADEVSVSSTFIKNEVDKFANVAKVTEANLGRLERRMQNQASKKAPGGLQADGASQVSAYSGASQKSRSSPSLAGKNIIGGAGGRNPTQSFDWARLDEYASYLHEQDALRQRLGMQALQKKLRGDLDGQIAEKQRRQDESKDEELRYHENAMIELERWKHAERAREEDRYQKLMREKTDRDAQLTFERNLKADELQRKKDDEAVLVEKIVTEMEAEQRRFEKKREVAKKSMQKIFNENMDDQRKREQDRKDEIEQEAQAMQEYNRILDEQEEQRAEEMQQRLERQNRLMTQLQVSVDQIQKQSRDNDVARSTQQMEEMDRHFFEAEQMKQTRLRQLKLENQAYLLKQTQEKKGRKEEEKQLQNIQAQILIHDTKEFHDVEKQKQAEKRKQNLDHRKELEQQILHRQQVACPTMSEEEVRMNAPLLNLVQRTLDEKESDRETLPRVEDE